MMQSTNAIVIKCVRDACFKRSWNKRLFSRTFHTSSILRVSGSQRIKFTEELNKQMTDDPLKRQHKVKLEFEKVLLESTTDPDKYEKQDNSVEKEIGHRSKIQDQEPSKIVQEELSSKTLQEDVYQSPAPLVNDIDDTDDGQVPSNIIGNLENLFLDSSFQPDPIVTEQVNITQNC